MYTLIRHGFGYVKKTAAIKILAKDCRPLVPTMAGCLAISSHYGCWLLAPTMAGYWLLALAMAGFHLLTPVMADSLKITSSLRSLTDFPEMDEVFSGRSFGK